MKVLIVLFILTLLGPFQALKAKGNTTSQFHLFSMGTLWKIDLYHPKRALNKDLIKVHKTRECSCGGIGIHDSFKFCCLTACQFDPDQE